MSAQALGSGAASAVGSNLVNAMIATPQGSAALATAAAVTVAAAPIIAVAAVGVGVISFFVWICGD